uniref:Prion protein n=1 Tax=Dicentrarchus labrax TaxID=13489 RepID=A0A8P4KG80_DICLA
MGRLCEIALVSLLVVFLLNTESTWAKRGSSSSGKKTSSTSSSSSRGSATNSKPSPQSPNRNSNPYPAGGSYPFPGAGNSKPGGYPRQNPPSYPGAGSNPNNNPARANPAGYPNQKPAGGYPAGGRYPAAGGYPAGGGYPAAGGYPAGGGYPAAGGYPAGGGYPAAGGYPAGGRYPAAGGYPNQYPGRGGTNQGGYPNQYPAAGGYPAGGGYPNQYPAGGGYPVRGGNTGQGWGQPSVNHGGYPGGYTNWNPNNKILSPRYGGGGYGYGSQGMGGSPFSRSVQNMGYQPKSTGFAKKAMLAAGVGAVAGMAVGYGLGRFPRPHFNLRNPEEEHYYNNYMYQRYGTKSTDEKDFGRDYVYKPPPRAESYEVFMGRCMNRTDVLKDSSSPTTKGQGGGDEVDDTVSIEEIGYPALIEQMKTRRCVEQFMDYSSRFLEVRKAEPQSGQPNIQHSRSSPLSYGVTQLFTSLFMLLSSMLLLQ